jgi:Tfp pilus assembly protein PilF
VSRIKAEFYLIRARQALEKGDFTEGDKYLRKSLDLNPNNAASWMLHADLYLTMGAAQKALKEYIISCENRLIQSEGILQYSTAIRQGKR